MALKIPIQITPIENGYLVILAGDSQNGQTVREPKSLFVPTPDDVGKVITDLLNQQANFNPQILERQSAKEVNPVKPESGSILKP